MLSHWKRHQYLVFILVFSLGLALFIEHRALYDLYAINDDVRNQAYWMNRIVNPGLYPNDLAARYFTQPSLISPFVKAIYTLASPWITPIRLSQLLPFVLAPVTTFLLYRLALLYGDKRYAFWICFIFNLFIWMISNLAGGLPRAFFFPLLFLFLWFLARRQCWGVLATCILQALTYPPVLFLSLGVLLLEALANYRHTLGRHQRLVCLVLALLISLAILMLRYGSTTYNHTFGHLMQGNWAEQMPEFQSRGRVPVFSLPSSGYAEGSTLDTLSDVLMRLPPVGWLLTLLLTVSGFLLYRRSLALRRLGELPVPKILWLLVTASITLYFCAAFSLFYLYVPQRYIEYTVPLFSVFILGGLLYRIETYKPNRLFRTGLMAASFCVACWFWRDDLIHIYSNQEQLLIAMHRLPESAQIAASYPIIANDIPVFSSRSVVVNREVAIPFHVGYYQQMKQRLKDWLQAYYSTDPAILRAFVRKYRVDTLVISLRDYEPQEMSSLHRLYTPYFGPQTSSLLTRDVLPGRRLGFLLPKLANRCSTFQSGPYAIIPAQALEKTQCYPSS